MNGIVEPADFIQRNRDFWASFQPRNADKKILIEEPVLPLHTHGTSIYAVILNQAKSYQPVFLFSSDQEIELLRSYIPTAEYITPPPLPRLSKLRMILLAMWKFIKLYMTRNILSFSYDSVKYGDIIYDTYLMQEKAATIRKIDTKLFFLIYSCIYRHELIRKLLKSGNFEGVLVTHQIGIRCGVMLRAALRHKYKGYLCKILQETTLQCFVNLEDVYNYQLKSTPEDIDAVISGLGREFDRFYRSVLDKQTSGRGTIDSMYAFSKHNKHYDNGEIFCRDYGLDPKKKNIFVMLHAFNDHPHSHFRWMVFKDFFDWFIETLRFAQKDDKVNWIFKQHPSIRFYPVKDVSFDTLFSGLPENIVYISENDQIDTRSLVNCADLVVTCLGSAGFELPAMGGIPSVTASDSYYSGLGFVFEAKNKEQYFEILGNAHRIERLTDEQKIKARAAYIFIYQLASVSMTAFPALSLEELKDNNMGAWYWEKVQDLYDSKEAIIKSEIAGYITKVSEPNFKQLTQMEKYIK